MCVARTSVQIELFEHMSFFIARALWAHVFNEQRARESLIKYVRVLLSTQRNQSYDTTTTTTTMISFASQILHSAHLSLTRTHSHSQSVSQLVSCFEFATARARFDLQRAHIKSARSSLISADSAHTHTNCVLPTGRRRRRSLLVARQIYW